MSGVRLNKYEAFKVEVRDNYVRYLNHSKINVKLGLSHRTTRIYVNRLLNEGGVMQQ
jgi:hypothetical protein